MKEIAQNIFIETELFGVTLGAVIDKNNLLYIDAPLRPENVRVWRSGINGKRKLTPSLVLLDSNLDRTIGSRYMECPIIAQQQVMEVYQERPITFKPDPTGSGADWEKIKSMNGFRWIYPEIVFSQTLDLRQNDLFIQLQFHPGPSLGNTWVCVPDEKVLFIGDTVISGQVPFLEDANLDDWDMTLSLLENPAFNDYTLVSGRSGVISQNEVDSMHRFITALRSAMASYATCSTGTARLDALISEVKIDQYFSISNDQKGNAIKRLSYGLRQYYLKHYQPETALA